MLEDVLNEIFDPNLLEGELPYDKHLLPPTFKEVQDVAQLILDDNLEEVFQRFFASHPHFLFRALPSSGDKILGLLTKPPVGNFYNADFAVFTVGQGGCGISLIELERPSDKLFTSKLTPARKLQTAMGQTDDWNEWLTNNQSTFINTGLDLLTKAPAYPNKTQSGSFRTVSVKNIKNAWNGFGGFETCYILNLIVVGRWSKLSDKEKKRLLFYNNKYRAVNFQIRTYDQLVRKGYDGPAFFW